MQQFLIGVLADRIGLTMAFVWGAVAAFLTLPGVWFWPGRTAVANLYAVGRSTKMNRSQAIISAGEGASAALDILSTEAGKEFLDYDSPPKE